MDESSSDDFSDIEYQNDKDLEYQQSKPQINRIAEEDSDDDDDDVDGDPTFEESIDATGDNDNDDDISDNFIAPMGGDSDAMGMHTTNQNDSLTSTPPMTRHPINDSGDTADETNNFSDAFLERSGVKLYNPRQYDSLNVDNETKRLFEFIEQFKPANIELETRLKPFIPDFIPAIGTVDAFLKPPRPDSLKENLGLSVLDEPMLHQSDPSTFHLQLQSVSKQTHSQHLMVHSIDDAAKNPQKITNWIQSIETIQRQSAAPTVFHKPMPDLEQLMQPWSETMNDYLQTNSDCIPPYNIELTLRQYASFGCRLFDIPEHDSKIVPSLHLLFSLYALLRENRQTTL